MKRTAALSRIRIAEEVGVVLSSFAHGSKMRLELGPEEVARPGFSPKMESERMRQLAFDAGQKRVGEFIPSASSDRQRILTQRASIHRYPVFATHRQDGKPFGFTQPMRTRGTRLRSIENRPRSEATPAHCTPIM